MPAWPEAQIENARRKRYDHVKEEKCIQQVEMTEKLLHEFEESGMKARKLVSFHVV